MISRAMFELCGTDGPSGFENDVSACAAKLLAPYVDEVKTDCLNNVIGIRRCGRPDAKKVLIDAHIDEVGLIVTGVEKGFLRFAALGGINPLALPASDVKILTEPPVYGVIAAMPPHLLDRKEFDNLIPVDNLFIDTGLPQEEAERLIPPGTPAVIAEAPSMLGDHCICAKALDDRACFACIIDALHKLGDQKLDFDLYILASSQEEVGRRGAVTASFDIAPDYAIVTDVCHGTCPGASGHIEGHKCGSGAVISLGPNMNRRFAKNIIGLCDELGISYTTAVSAGDSYTNAKVIQLAGCGTVTALISLPLKYMHTPTEVADLNDAKAVSEVLYSILTRFEEVL